MGNNSPASRLVGTRFMASLENEKREAYQVDAARLVASFYKTSRSGRREARAFARASVRGPKRPVLDLSTRK